MRSIVVFNNKGGVGKTTFLCNLAAFIALKVGKRVLVVDADPQSNATTYSIPESTVNELYAKQRRQTVDTFLDPLRRGKGYFSGSFECLTSPRFGFDLIPGDPSLSLSEDLLAEDWTSGTSGQPRGLQTTLVFRDIVGRFADFDFIFFDVGPSLGALNRSVLIACDFFVVPMASDIFSILAIGNMSQALQKWKRGLEKGLADYLAEENTPYVMGNAVIDWKLQFAGYVTQQYTAKMVRGVRQPVSAYERIINHAPMAIQDNLVTPFSDLPSETDYRLGDIPNLHSVVPLSQVAHCPIFMLKAADGVVGAHFAKVKDTELIYEGIAKRVLRNVGDST